MDFKKYLGCIVLSMLLSTNAIFGMLQLQHTNTQVFFIPDNQEKLNQEILSKLENAQESINLIGSWLESDEIKNKLIELKNQGKNIKVILEEIPGETESLMNELLENNITPTILPFDYGIISNKFIVIDNSTLILATGDLNEPMDDNNYRDGNVLIIDSMNLANNFNYEFSQLAKKIAHIYLTIIVKNNWDELPEWIRKTAPTIFKQNQGVKNIGQSLSQLSKTEQDRLKAFFALVYA